MAEFQEVTRQKERMCNSILCYKCDIWRLCGDDSSKCQRFIDNNPNKAEEVIMSWAAEHPEPEYPTWGEYLTRIGVVNYIEATGYVFTAPFFKPIPADIAQELGIEPKEG